MKILRQHWPEYLMEAWGLGVFMISAGVVTIILEYPASPLHKAIPNPFVRLVLIGIAMGATAVGITYSPWGKQSGAHINPAVTITFLRLGKIRPWDAAFYVLFQFIGGLLGVLLVAALFKSPFTNSPVNYIVTVPGSSGVAVAFVAEMVIAFIMMLVVLFTSNHQKLARFTGVFAGFLVSMYVIFESPLSGFGMNPARAVASAMPSGIWTAIWLYFIAPILGMLLAAEAYLRVRGGNKVFCAKLHHHNNKRCIHCQYRLQKVAAMFSIH